MNAIAEPIDSRHVILYVNQEGITMGNDIQGAVTKRLYLAGIVFICMLVLSISGIACTKTSFETKWVGLLTFGKEYQGVDPGIIHRESMFVTEYNDDIIIGLRDDGVVVWKWAVSDSIASK